MAENIFPYELPENWHWSTLGNIAKWGSGGTPSRKIPEYYRGNISWIKTGELNDGYIFESEEHITADAIKNSSAKIFPKNSVVIAMYGATIGKVGILGVESSMNQACACAVCNENIYFKFLFYYALSQRENFIRKSKGGAQPNISQEIIKKFPIPLPPLDEQKRIVAVIESLFEKLDAAKSIVQKILDGYELRRAAILHKAFTGDLTKNFRTEHGLTLEDWQEKTLGDVLNLSKKKTDSFNENLKYVGLENISKDSCEITFQSAAEIKSTKNIFYSGDLLYGKLRPYLNKHGIPNFDGVCSTDILVLNANELSTNEFINYFFSLPTFVEYAVSNSKGINLPRVSLQVILQAEINLPSLNEQKEIVRVLADLLDKEQRTKEIAEKILSEIDLLKRTILARAFRGELGTKY